MSDNTMLSPLIDAIPRCTNTSRGHRTERHFQLRSGIREISQLPE